MQEFVCLHPGAGQAPQWWRLCYGKVTETPQAFLLFEGRGGRDWVGCWERVGESQNQPGNDLNTAVWKPLLLSFIFSLQERCCKEINILPCWLPLEIEVFFFFFCCRAILQLWSPALGGLKLPFPNDLLSHQTFSLSPILPSAQATVDKYVKLKMHK